MRRAGILLHVGSLPSRGPIGDLGAAAHEWLAWLESAGCTSWQLLPLSVLGRDHSPYASPSAFASEPAYLSVESLVQDGLLEPVTAPDASQRVDWEAVASWKRPLLNQAALRLWATDPQGTEDWARQNPWARDWALFHALATGHGALEKWPANLRNREPSALALATREHGQDVRIALALQRLFDRQWKALKVAADQRSITLIGDIPLFVSSNGVDTWVRPELFCVDEWRRPTHQAGVPPDDFSPQGQLWGNPHYEWEAHLAEDFAWWRARVARCLEQVDRARLDHFRGLVAAWAVPPDAEVATKGRWLNAPGRALLTALGQQPLIAEDLGFITAPVRELRDEFNLPGMKVLQLGFGGDPEHPFLPHTWEHGRWVVYTGTHDNNTAQGWFDQADPETRAAFQAYTGGDGTRVPWDMIQLAWSSPADDAIAPLQDLLSLGEEARMNVPGTQDGNWSWRALALPGAEQARGLRNLGGTHGRLGNPR